VVNIKKIVPLIVLIGFLFFSFGLRAKTLLLVGAAKKKITPLVETFEDKNKNGQFDFGEPFEDLNGNGKWDPVYLAGYSGGRFALGVHDDLWVRSIVITQDHQTLVFISLDLIGFLFDEVNKIEKELEEKFQLKRENIFLASTHSHSGPDSIGLWGNGGSGKDPQYMAWVREQIVLCVEESLGHRESATLFFGKIQYSKPIEDGRPPKIIDDLLLTLQAINQKGQTIATLVNYAMHAEVLDKKNRLITSDYPGYLRETLEEKLGGISLFFAADIGGMQTPKVFFHNFSNSKKIGEDLAHEVIQSLKNTDPMDFDALNVKSLEVFFPIENPRFLELIQSGILGSTKEVLIEKEGKLTLPSRISMARLGSVVFVSIPGELFPESGNKLRSKLPYDPLFLLGLCNNEIGYIVPQEEWRADGYEESMSLGPKTDDILRETIFHLSVSFDERPEWFH